VIRYLEQRFGQFSIPNITLFLIAGQVMMFIATMNNEDLFEKMVLIPEKVLSGEVFRLLTFLLMPPNTTPLFAFFFWYLFYLMGTALEQFWGTFRYNLFLLIGFLATVSVAFATPGSVATNGFLQGSVFLAFAWLNPDFTLHFMFVLPVRIKWFALLTWIMYGMAILGGSWSTRFAIAASVLNFFVFFGRDVWYKITDGRRHMVRQASRFAERPPEYLHKCEVCGITDTSHPQEDFRYCSQCLGDVAYCEAHLRDHDHLAEVQDDADRR